MRSKQRKLGWSLPWKLCFPSAARIDPSAGRGFCFPSANSKLGFGGHAESVGPVSRERPASGPTRSISGETIDARARRGGSKARPAAPWAATRWLASVGDDFPASLTRVEAFNAGGSFSEGGVPGVYLVAEEEGEIVGGLSVRYALNAYLRDSGGHVGSCVPSA